MPPLSNNRVSAVESEVEDNIDQEENGSSKPMQLEIHTFKIAGISPLLQNNPTEFIGKGGDEEELVGKKKYVDAEEARLRLYIDADGDYSHPSECIVKALVKASSGKKISAGKKKVSASMLIKSGVFVAEPYMKILDQQGDPSKKYSIDRRGVVIGKARVLRCRPCWAKWFMHFPLEIDVAIISPEMVGTILALAGRYPGIGDYRPEKGGPFGRFEVISCDS